MLKNIIRLLLLFWCSGIFAQVNNLELKQTLSISDGLAHNGVTSILEDSRGFLWVGTYDGLNKYDGYEIKVYKNTVDKNILVNNRVRSIAEDKQNKLWIGTDEGISIYDYDTEHFSSLKINRRTKKNKKDPIILDIEINKKSGLVLCATHGDGILIFNNDQTFMGQYIPLESEFGNNILFYKGIELDENNYIFSTSIGVLQFNLTKGEFKKILKDEIVSSNFIVKVDDNTLMMTNANGITVVEYTLNNDSYHFEVKHKGFKEYRLRCLLIDDLRNLWIGTMNDGLIYVKNVDDFIKNKSDKMAQFSPETSLLRSSCIAQVNNSCWYGTFNEGLFKFNINENPFKKYNTDMHYDFGIKSNNIGYISPFDDDRVYLGAYKISGTSLGGIGVFNTKKQVFEPLPFDISQEAFQNAGGIYVDSKRDLWIKIIRKGLFRVKAGTRDLEKITSDKFLDFDNIGFRSFTEDKQGNLWIGCYDGMYKISLRKDRSIEKIESLNSNSLFKDKKLSLVRYVYADPFFDFVWVGTDTDGLFRIKLDESKPLSELQIDQFNHSVEDKLSISSDFVTSIIRLPNDELWVGTEGGGICKVIDSDAIPKFISFSEKQGLSNNAVKSILYDNLGNLWISTNIGLNRFDTKTQRFRRFLNEDGLPFEDFWFASTKLNNGTLLFSGLDGLCYFNPKDLQNNETIPRFEFGDIKVFNKQILPGDSLGNRILYKKRLKDQDELVLKHNENVFSIQLTSLHFSNPYSHPIKYRLLPISEEWIEVPSNQQFAYYNGLQSGEYEFNVMVSNSFDKWSEPNTLKIIIKPPFWKTNKAYALYFLLSVFLIYAGAQIILRIQKLKHNLQIEQFEKDKVKEINIAKLRFFSNISHELKTPLTLIKGPINELHKQFRNNFDVKEKLEIVNRQSKKISHLINQVHDFQKAEAKALKMNFSRFYFNKFIEDIAVDFKFMADIENKNLEVYGSETPIIVSADKDKLEKVFNNILSNAFKYTNTKDTIKVNYTSDEKDLIISVSDTGNGIDKADLSHVFERFYQSHKNQDIHSSGSGIGLSFTKLLVEMHYGYITAESILNEGTTIHVRLPIVKKGTIDDLEKVEEAILSAEKEFNFSNQLIAKNNPKTIQVGGGFSESLIFYVEDNLDMRMFVSKELSKCFKLKTFKNGQECLDAMEDEWPDLVISDVQMPILNGLDLCKSIKSDVKTSHIPIILLTALTNIEDKIQGIRDGADAYIIKPFNLQHLITRTETLLTNRKQLRERFQIGIPLSKENNINSRNDNAFLEKLYNLIEENLDNQNLDLNSFTKELYLNRTHFYQKVKALTNLTPFEVLKNYRLKKAADFLVNKKVSVNEVYIMTGFKSRTHFSKLFKEKYNVSPGKYASEAINKLEL